MRDLTVSLIQTHLHWHAAEKNRQHFSNLIAKASATDLIILPETFTTGFSMDGAKHAETMSGATVTWMLDEAAKKQAVVTGSLFIQDNNHCFNRLIWATPDGQIDYYDKRHLFRMLDEHRHYSAGSSRKVFTLYGWKICPIICYDLRFPVWCRNQNDYDMLLLIANWPAKRRQIWRTLVHARAIENLAYVSCVNRIGSDDNGIDYSGDSLVTNYCGEILLDCQNNNCVETLTLSKQALIDFKQQFPAHLDADNFNLVV